MSAHLPDELLAAHLDGALSPTERDAADAHLEVCGRCREELGLAVHAREALRALPDELRPPVDIAAAVTREVAGEPPAVPPRGSPRWYRAAGVVAAAAAIALVLVIVPNLGGRNSKDRPATGAAESALSAPEAIDAAGQASGVGPDDENSAATQGDVETVDRDFDAASLRDLIDDSSRSAATLEGGATSAELVSEPEAGIVDCVRSAAGETIPPEAKPVRLIVATYEGIPVDIVVFAVDTGEDVTLRAVAAALDDCRLLAATG
jgi:putative zinc finger protein